MIASAIQSEIRDLRRQISALKRKLPKTPSAAFKGRTRAEDRKAKRETHRDETSKIRALRMLVAGGQCEAALQCNRTQCTASHRCPSLGPLHMHHLEGGSGRRRQKQSVENVRMLCWKHHREAHRAQHPEGKP
jgi:hypothetical protein